MINIYKKTIISRIPTIEEWEVELHSPSDLESEIYPIGIIPSQLPKRIMTMYARVGDSERNQQSNVFEVFEIDAHALDLGNPANKFAADAKDAISRYLGPAAWYYHCEKSPCLFAGDCYNDKLFADQEHSSELLHVLPDSSAHRSQQYYAAYMQRAIDFRAAFLKHKCLLVVHHKAEEYTSLNFLPCSIESFSAGAEFDARDFIEWVTDTGDLYVDDVTYMHMEASK